MLRDPADMSWGERIGTIADPDGKSVALFNEPGPWPDLLATISTPSIPQVERTPVP